MMTNDKILVHCLAGQNRSAACIVAYLSAFSKKPLSVAQAIETIEKANQKRNALALTQISYREALLDFPEWANTNR
jgi:protein-tyrosine phosphatase